MSLGRRGEEVRCGWSVSLAPRGRTPWRTSTRRSCTPCRRTGKRSRWWPDARRLAIKLMGVPGSKLLGVETQTQDFVLIIDSLLRIIRVQAGCQNVDVRVADQLKSFVGERHTPRFTEATAISVKTKPKGRPRVFSS